MKKFFVFTLLLLMSAGIAQAQDENTLSSEDLINDIDNITEGNVNRVFKHIDVTGTPYYETKFQQGRLKYKDQWTENLFLRLDVRNNIIELQKFGEIVYIDGHRIDEIEIFDKKRTYLKNGYYAKSIPTMRKSHFMRVIYEDEDVTVFERRTVKRLVNTVTYGTATQKDYYDWSKKTYALIDGDAKSFKLKDKDIFKLFPDHKDEIKSYIKKNKLKVKREDDFRKAMEYAKTLRTS